MSAKYLLRFDDISPTMNWSVWTEVENFLIEIDAKPILAVVPDNQDRDLQVSQPNPQFWDRVRQWQNMGWTIGLHGYQHLWLTQEAGLLGLNDRSEFAGLPLEKQQDKLDNAVSIFVQENVRPQIWIAPFHSFDSGTITALKTLGIHCISDGFSIWPYRDCQGIIWIPQQLWKFRPLPFGVWTVCFHFNHWRIAEILKFRKDLYKYQNSIICFNELVDTYQDRQVNFYEQIFARFLQKIICIKHR